MVKVAVFGAGIGGCVLSTELAKGGADVTLFELAPGLGGLHRSITAEGYAFDIGAFVFGPNHNMFQTYPELLDVCPKVDSRLAAARSTGFVDTYPMTISGLRKQYGNAFMAKCMAEAVASKAIYRKKDTVQNWGRYFIGSTLYERSGLQGYIKRLYHVPDSEVDVRFAQSRMATIAKRAGMRKALKSIGSSLAKGKKANLDSIGQPPPAVARVRPEGGFVEMYDVIRKRMETEGVDLRIGTKVDSITKTDAGFDLVSNGETLHYDYVFSTIPVVAMARMLDVPTPERPETVDVYSLFYELDGEFNFPHTVLHNLTDSGQWKRMTIFSRYYGKKNGKHYFTVEGTSKAGNDQDDTLVEGERDFQAWLDQEGVIEGKPRFISGVVTRNGYPVFRKETVASGRALIERIQETGVELVGRQGSFDYLSSSQVAEQAQDRAAAFLAAHMKDEGRAAA